MGFPNQFFCGSWVVGFWRGRPWLAGRWWKEELGRWLKPFLDRLGHKARRQMSPLYVSGLIGPDDRKSIQPMAERLALGEYDQLHHFIAGGVWDATPVETELLVQADRLVGGRGAVLVIDDTAIPKKGAHSVGVAAQYASSLGKTKLDEQADPVGPSGCSSRISNGTNETGDGSGGDRSCHRGRCALWLHLSGCRLWAERAVPPGADSSQTCLGSRYPAAPQGVPCRCADDLAGCRTRPSPSAARS